MDHEETVARFAERHHLAFRDARLLRTALTHRSFLNEHPDLGWEDNERLEFLGDAVLDFMLAEYLYLHFPAAHEGEMTSLRAVMVRRTTLARFADEMAVGEFLLMGHGEAETGGRERPATLCATFEALVGALYLDHGLAGVAELVMPLVERELAGAHAEAVDKDPKSRLQELAQGAYGLTPRYRTVHAEGPDHAKVFTVAVTVGAYIYGEGAGANKQTAAQRAAEDALAHQDEWPEASVADVTAAHMADDAQSVEDEQVIADSGD
jgi:ribonuclease III